MKKLLISFFAAMVLLPAVVQAQQATPANPYDVLSRVLVPIASVFSPTAKQHALSAVLVLEEMTDLPPELAGSRVELLLQPPDRVLIRGIYAGKTATLCRAGESVWITPNTPPFDALANPPDEILKKKKKKKHDSGALGPMVLPFPPQQLVFLPILLQAKDAGEENGLRMLDVKLMPELAKGLGVEDWSARLSLTPANQPVRLQILGPGWSMTAKVESLEYAKELPDVTWLPPGNAVVLDAQQVQQWVDVIGRQVDTHRPKNAK